MEFCDPACWPRRMSSQHKVTDMMYFQTPHSKPYARLAGAFYLTIAVAGGFSIAYVPSQIQVTGNAAQTVSNLLDNAGLFQLGILGDTVVMMAEIMVTSMLFFMFRPVNPTLSLAAALARAMMVAVMASMLFFHAGALYLADPSGALSVLPEAERMQWAMFMLYLNSAGVWIWQIFFSLHLLLLGWLVTQSGVYPKMLGCALALGGLGYILDSAYAFSVPDQHWIGVVRIGLLTLVTLAEIGFAITLVVTGRSPQPKQ